MSSLNLKAAGRRLTLGGGAGVDIVTAGHRMQLRFSEPDVSVSLSKRSISFTAASTELKLALSVPRLSLGLQTRPIRLTVAAAGGSTGSAQTYASVTYGSDLAEGQIVYLESGVARPATRRMVQAVVGLLAVVVKPGAAGTAGRVLLGGLTSSAAYGLTAGPVFLGDDSYPTSTPYDDRSTAHYVPLGFSEGGTSFFFDPTDRHLRS